MTEFPAAPLDRLTRTITTAVVIGMVVIVILTTVVSPEPETAWIIPFFALIGAQVWAMSPKGYKVGDGELVIDRRAWPSTEFALEGLTRIEDPRHLGLRVLGSGGALGYWGRFRRRDIGTFRAYLTSRDEQHLVAAQTDAGVVLVSPEDASSFRTAIESIT